jgi:hypothetical protein
MSALKERKDVEKFEGFEEFETVREDWRNICQMTQTRHRSDANFSTNRIASLHVSGFFKKEKTVSELISRYQDPFTIF